MTSLTQQNRHIRVESPLGTDTLLLAAFEIEERFSIPFEMKLDLLSERSDLEFEEIVGKDVTVAVTASVTGPQGGGEERFFNGFVRRFRQFGGEGALARYHAFVVPWFWFLTRTRNHRIFQSKSVPDIVEEVFSAYPFAKGRYRTDFDGQFAKREFCVQYGESDFHFVSRLLEEEGIHYFFEHEDGKHTMVLANHGGAHQECPGLAVVRYNPNRLRAQPDDRVLAIEREAQVCTNKVSLWDFDYKNPGSSVKGQDDTDGPEDLESYEYPGRFENPADGDRYAKIRLEAANAEARLVRGTSICRGFSPGYRFELTEHSQNHYNVEYLLTSVSHSASAEGSYIARSKGVFYSNSFVAIPADCPFRAEPKHRKPVIHGVQTAIVVGSSGDEIHSGKYGCVRVQFHWDRAGKKNENSSCWVRVAQTFVGQGWGALAVPRCGQEVVVEFVDGDPDRPLITGCVYNGTHDTPYPLPASQTITTLKTHSSKGGGKANFNEIRIEDKAGKEEIYIHAERDHVQHTENDRSETVGRDRSLVVMQDKTETVDRNKTITVTGEHMETIQKSMTVNVGMNLTETVAINYAEVVGAAMELVVGAAMAVVVGLHKTEQIGSSSETKIGGSMSQTVGGDGSVDIKKDLTEKIGGDRKVTVEKDFTVQAKKIVLTAKEELLIKVGSATIQVKKSGDVNIKAKSFNLKASSDVKIKGSKITQN